MQQSLHPSGQQSLHLKAQGTNLSADSTSNHPNDSSLIQKDGPKKSTSQVFEGNNSRPPRTAENFYRTKVGQAALGMGQTPGFQQSLAASMKHKNSDQEKRDRANSQNFTGTNLNASALNRHIDLASGRQNNSGQGSGN